MDTPQTALPAPTPAPTCTAFDHDRRIASGAHADVAIAVNAHMHAHPDAAVLIFDDRTGQQIDFDLRGSDQEIAARVEQQFPAGAGQPESMDAGAGQPRPVGRPKLGVVSREVTLLPRHWEWLGEQAGGASVTLRKLVEEARRAGPSDKVRLRKLHERAYRFMSAMAGNRPNFEEASRALFANNIPELERLMAAWPRDVAQHVIDLYTRESP
jgi:hypothetical protein